MARARSYSTQHDDDLDDDLDYETDLAYDARRIDSDTRQWAMILHFSLLAGLLVPLAGLVAPIVIWQVKKNELPALDEHGRAVMNWIISSILYIGVSVVLCFVLIGIPLLIALAVCVIVFPLIGGLKASSGELWEYPLAIRFFSVAEISPRRSRRRRSSRRHAEI